MILLPTLIRIATDNEYLTYQVAPGLSNLPANSPAIHQVAARTAYLVDGDNAGKTKRKQLIRAGVPAGSVFSLPDGHAVEDLLTPESYLEAVNSHLVESGLIREKIEAGDLDQTKLAANSVAAWCRSHKIAPPGKTAIANRLVFDSGKIQLKESARLSLIELDKELLSILQ